MTTIHQGSIGSQKMTSDAAFGQTPIAEIQAKLTSQTEDPSGARAVEITTLFDGTVQEVKHLSNPSAGRISSMTKGILAASVLSLGTVMTLFGASYVQVRNEKNAESAQKQTPKHQNRGQERARDVAAGGFLLLGTAGLFYGLHRFSSEKGDREYSVGIDPGASYQVSAEGLPSTKFPIVRSDGNSFELVLCENMKGTVSQGAEKTDVHAYKQTVKHSAVDGLFNTSSIAIPEGVVFELAHGGATFRIQSVRKPRHYPVPLRVDWRTQSYTGGVMASAAAFMGLLFAVPPEARSLTLDGFDSRRLVKLSAKPELDENPDWLKAKKLEKPTPELPNRNESRTRNRPVYAQPVQTHTVVTATPGPRTLKERQDAAREVASNAGIIGLMRQGSMLSVITRDPALGAGAAEALDRLTGDSLVADPNGNGGPSNLVGTSPGGGFGDGTISTGLPFGGGGPGVGKRPAGPALRRHLAQAPTPEIGRVEVNSGQMDREIIRRVIRNHSKEVKFCYEKALLGNKDLEGRVQVKFLIGPTGKVGSALIEASTLRSGSTEQCVAEAVRRWEFPKPPNGIVTVTYPFVFKPAAN
jgi:TonB family protein